jgi:hypothetical protein
VALDIGLKQPKAKVDRTVAQKTYATLTSTPRMGLSTIVLRRWCSCSHILVVLQQRRGGNRSVRTPRLLSLFLHHNCHISHSASSHDTLNSGEVFLLMPYQSDSVVLQGGSVRCPTTMRCYIAINSEEAEFRM